MVMEKKPQQEQKAEYPQEQLQPEQKGQEPRTKWNIGNVGYVLITGLLLSLLPSLFVNNHSNLLGLNLIAYTLQIGAFSLLPLYIVLQRHHLPPAALGLQPLRFIAIPKGILWGVVLYGVNLGVAFLVNLVLPEKMLSEQSAILLLQMATSPLEQAMLGFFIVLLAPIAEEILFRGFLLPPLRDLLGSRSAILVGASIFAAVHGNIFTFLPLFAGGIGFCWLYEKHRDLSYSIIAHMTWNAIAFALYMLSAASA